LDKFDFARHFCTKVEYKMMNFFVLFCFVFSCIEVLNVWMSSFVVGSLHYTFSLI